MSLLYVSCDNFAPSCFEESIGFAPIPDFFEDRFKKYNHNDHLHNSKKANGQ